MAEPNYFDQFDEEEDTVVVNQTKQQGNYFDQFDGEESFVTVKSEPNEEDIAEIDDLGLEFNYDKWKNSDKLKDILERPPRMTSEYLMEQTILCGL